MTLEQFSSIAEIFGVSGVFLSLLYVARQLKQANAAARAAAQQALVAQGATFSMAVATLPDLATVFAKVHFHDLVRDGATETERIQLGYAVVALIAPIYLAYQQMKEGVLTKEEAEAVLRPQGAFFTKPYLKSVWPILSGAYSREFASWFEARYVLGAGGAQSVDSH